MRLSLRQDILFNIILPILTGSCIYFNFSNIQLTGFWRNQLPDGLWAYALISSLLIIWNRQINITWVVVIFIVYVIFETLQYFQIINGTADLWDIFIYFLFSTISLLTNKFFISSTKKMHHDNSF